MYMFNPNIRYNLPIVAPIVAPFINETCTFLSFIPIGDLSKRRSAWLLVIQWVWAFMRQILRRQKSLAAVITLSKEELNRREWELMGPFWGRKVRT